MGRTVSISSIRKLITDRRKRVREKLTNFAPPVEVSLDENTEKQSPLSMMNGFMADPKQYISIANAQAIHTELKDLYKLMTAMLGVILAIERTGRKTITITSSLSVAANAVQDCMVRTWWEELAFTINELAEKTPQPAATVKNTAKRAHMAAKQYADLTEQDEMVLAKAARTDLDSFLGKLRYDFGTEGKEHYNTIAADLNKHFRSKHNVEKPHPSF
ncbi:MAG: hypothetical protein U9N14_06410 [Pseudomonadota bacterium]|nr:hypothetical protein [Pseudomonadota bacterium]